MAVFKKIWNVFTTVVLLLVIVLAILLVGVRLFGFKPYTVLSGSMEPTYHVGSLIYVKSVDVTSLDVDDPITFYIDEKTVATHRIIEVKPDSANPDARYFRTQGDANDTPDDPIHSSSVIGKPIFTIPYLGYLSNFLQHPLGRNVAIASCMALLLLMLLPDLFTKKRD